MQLAALREAVDNLLDSLNSEIPANPIAKENEKLTDKLEKELQYYFHELELAFPIDKIEQIYRQEVPTEEK